MRNRDPLDSEQERFPQELLTKEDLLSEEEFYRELGEELTGEPALAMTEEERILVELNEDIRQAAECLESPEDRMP
jgi:hypothetical protein